MPWNPETYNKFKTERFAPFYDLLELVRVRPDIQAIDLGCGTGELTRKLWAHLPGAQVSGIDASAEMLRESAAFRNDRLTFSHMAVADIIRSGTRWDLVFSNAALQWIGHHTRLFPQLISLLKPGGQLVVQIPSNHDHVTHRTLQAIASEFPFKEALNGWTRVSPVLSIEAYAHIFFESGGTDITVYEKIYPHVLRDADALLEWVSGTAMLPYMERLPVSLQESFTEAYRQQIREAFPAAPVFYPFKRILMAATF